MSKKKSGSTTMTLKDFHGGSIPSDLPLPSAPGLSARLPDRPSPWASPPAGSGSGAGMSASASGIRNPRPGSDGVGSHRGPSDSPFLSVIIGRHFDEDERKPFDSSAPPRRPLSDPAPRTAPFVSRSDPAPRPLSSPGVQGGQPSAWGPRRNLVAVPHTVAPSPVVPVSAAERMAQASAVEKISSGRWGRVGPTVAAAVPRPAAAAADVEVIRDEEPAGLDRRFAEEPRPRTHGDGARYGIGVGGPHVQQQSVEVEGERPKLKLLPRMRTVEAGETRVSVEKQFYQPPLDAPHMENAHGMHVNMNMPRPGSAGTDSGSRAIERPRLNLKPRLLPVKELEKITERERKTVFGGARPRELVLKERGIDSPVATSPEVTSPANRAKNEVSKTELKLEPAAPTTRRSENFLSEHRNGRDLERKEYRPDLEKVERTSWRNDNRRSNTRENEKAVEGHQEPDTWRKPVFEQPKPEVVPVPGVRHGKAASALDLAQAFSRSVSDAKSDNHGPTSQRSLPSRGQVPFSRLTDTRDFYSGPGQRQINGY